MTEFDDILANAKQAGYRQDVEYRQQPNARKSQKRVIYKHKGKSFRERFTLFDTRRSKAFRREKRQNGAEYIKRTLDEKYHMAGFGAKVFSAYQNEKKRNSGHNPSERVWESDIRRLDKIAKNLITDEKRQQVANALRSDELQTYILKDLCAEKGTQEHQYHIYEQTWNTIGSQLKIDLQKLKNGGQIKDCNKNSQRLFSYIAVKTKEIEVTPELIKELTRAYFDINWAWSDWVRHGTLKELRSFHTSTDPNKDPDEPYGLHYIGNLISAAHDWHRLKLSSNDVGDVEKEDVDWLVYQLQHLIDGNRRIDKRFKNDLQLDSAALADSLENTYREFKEDAEYLLSGKNILRATKLALGSELKRDDILDWHDDFFRGLIDKRKAHRLKTQKGATEARLRRRMDTLPELKAFAYDKANRGLYKGLGFGATDKPSTFVKTWMEQTYLLRRIDRSRDNCDANQLNYDNILSVLDDYAEFKIDFDALLSNDAKALGSIDNRRDVQKLEELEDKARDLEIRLLALDTLSVELDWLDDELDTFNPPLRTRAYTLLKGCHDRICSGIAPCLNVSQAAKARLNRKRLMQLPAIQAFQNKLGGSARQVGAADEPCELLISAVVGELKWASSDVSQPSDQAKKRLEEALREWINQTMALDRYADFANEKGGQLMELELMAAAKDGLKNANSEKLLKKLRRELNFIEQQVEALDSATKELRSALGPRANLPTVKDALEACDMSVKAIRWQIRNEDLEPLEEEPSQAPAAASGTRFSPLSFLKRLGLGSKEAPPAADVAAFSPTFIQGQQTLPVPELDLARNTTTVMEIAKAIGLKKFGFYEKTKDLQNPYAKKALQKEDFTDAAIDVAYAATRELPAFDQKLSEQMVANPVPSLDSLDEDLGARATELANVRLILKELRLDLEALKRKINGFPKTLPPVEREVFFPDHDDAFKPNVSDRKRIYLRAIDTLNGHLAVCEKAFDNRLTDFTTYLRLGHLMHHDAVESAASAEASEQTLDVDDIENIENFIDDIIADLDGEDSGDELDKELLDQILDLRETTEQNRADRSADKAGGNAAQGSGEPLQK